MCHVSHLLLDLGVIAFVIAALRIGWKWRR